MNLLTELKFDKRARKCIFVGVPTGQKTYKVYNLDFKKLFTSRDAIFHEIRFPYSKPQLKHEASTPVLPLPFDHSHDLVTSQPTEFHPSQIS